MVTPQAKNTKGKGLNPELQKTLLSIAVSCGIFLFIVYVAFLPALKQSLSLTKQIKDKQTNMTKVQTSKDELVRLEGEIAGLKKQSGIVNERLFWEKDSSKFLDKLTQLAVDLPIEFVTLKPEAVILPDKKDSKTKSEPQLARMPFSVTLRADYNNLVKFLDRVEKSEKYIRISTLSIESNLEDIKKHNVTIELNIFIRETG